MATSPGSFSIGRDATLILTMPDGTRIQSRNLDRGRATQDIKMLTFHPLNSPPLARAIPRGWHFEFTFWRIDSNLANIFANLEPEFWFLNVIVPNLASGGSMTIEFSEINGSKTRAVFTGVLFYMQEFANLQVDREIDQTIHAFASYRSQ